MKALTICQPYAHLIVHGRKRIENRTWYPPPGVEGREIVIHAGKSRKYMTDMHGTFDDMAFGSIVGKAYLDGCCSAWELRHGSPPAHVRWAMYHSQAEGPICWILGDVKRLAQPIPCKGQQGLWNVDDNIFDGVELIDVGPATNEL